MRIRLCLALFLATCGVAPAGLLPPPPGEPSFGPISLADGFPIWYQDQNGLKLQLCLDQAVVNPADGTTVFPCLTDEPFPGLPLSFPTNFGAEAFWWAADAVTAFTSSNGFVGQALLVTGLEAAFFNGFAFEGQQAAFGRIRIRVDAPVPGQYRVTHPFGQVTYDVAVSGQRAIDETQDVGLLQPPAASFVAALGDGPVGPELPGEAVPRVDDTLPDRSIGPFLTAAADPDSRVVLGGNVYLAIPARIDPLTGLEDFLTVPIAGGIGGQDYFEVELIPTEATPAGFLLNAAEGTNVVRVEDFTLAGKVFNDGPNVAPTAHPDRAGTAPGAAAALPALGNDRDDPGGANVHGLNVQAVALVSGADLVTAATTAEGGTVTRTVDLVEGRALLLYTPPPNFTGTDFFTYVTQDTGGLLSNPTTVAVAVEDLAVDRAEFRGRVLKWRVQGTSSDVSPRAFLDGSQAVPPALSEGTGRVTLAPAPDGTSVAFTLDVAGLTGAAEGAVLHLGLPGEEGPALFVLAGPFGDPVSGSGRVEGILTAAGLAPAGDVTNFSEAVAALFSGRTYVNVVTAANPSGEVRGRIVPNTITVRLGDEAGAEIGTAPVRADGSWSLDHRQQMRVPGLAGTVRVTSANGVSVTGIPVRAR